MKIISYSLWGNNPIYTIGAISNAKLAQEIYPDWISRFYVDASTVPSNIIEELKKYNNVQIVYMPDNIGWSGSLWRFYPAVEDDVSVMISRDCDSRLNLREKACVNYWLSRTDRKVMTIRDTCAHQSQMMGGMWGVRDRYLIHMKPVLDSLIETTRNKCIKGVDQEFLNTKVYLRALGVVNGVFDRLAEGSWERSQFISFDDIAFGAKRFGDMEHRPHDRDWMVPTIIQRKYGDEYRPCIHCGLKHDNEYIGKCESLTQEECKFLNFTDDQLKERADIIKYFKLYNMKQFEYGLSPVQHEHGSEKIQ